METKPRAVPAGGLDGVRSGTGETEKKGPGARRELPARRGRGPPPPSPRPGLGRAIRWLKRRRAQVAEVVVLALLAYVPFLASPGSLSSDSKQYLYLDPSRFLARAAYMWDDRVGAGTVSHQHIGYWFPMGPWFWAADHLGVSTELAQRVC